MTRAPLTVAVLTAGALGVLAGLSYFSRSAVADPAVLVHRAIPAVRGAHGPAGAPASGPASLARVAATPPAYVPRPAVMDLVQRIDQTLRFSRYAHSTRVDVRAGSYEFDCSGFTAWVLARTAPVAHRAVMARVGGSGRPLARDYYRHFAAAPTTRPSQGWLRVTRVADALPGDVLAWLRPREILSQNTGHVVFITEPPTPVDAMPDAYLLRIADASSYQHQDDSRAGTGRTGFGFGTILVVADPATGAPVQYGWFGRYSRWVLATQMAIGRPVR